jgi:hypothetical protein
VGANQNYNSEGSDGETYAARKFGGPDVRRLGDSDGEGFNVVRGDSVVVTTGG